MKFQNFSESFKYFSVLFHMRTNFIQYLKAVISYRLKRKVEFPKAIVKLEGVKFIARENSMDIAHLSDFYERKTTKLLSRIKPGIFIDVGTHIGRYSIILAKRKWKVISIEPSNENFEQLERNIKLNNLQDKIETVNVACSDKNEKKNLYFVPQNEGLTSLEKKEGARSELVQVKKLDDITKNIKLNPNSLGVIKIDVEGFELNVLKGALDILKKGSPLLIIEITDEEDEKKIKKFLNNLGFVNKEVLDSRNFIFTKKIN